MKAQVRWNGDLSFEASADSGFKLPLGADKEVGGNNDGFRPIELFAIGLAGCTAMDVVSILIKKRQRVTDFEVRVQVERAQEHPKVFTSGVVEYLISGNHIEESAVLRAIELSATRYCPAQAMFSKIMPIELRYQIFEDNKEGKPILKSSGVYAVAAES